MVWSPKTKAKRNLLNDFIWRKNTFNVHSSKYPVLYSTKCSSYLIISYSLFYISYILIWYYYRFFRPLLKQIKEASETRIILDCKTDSIFEILKQAQQVGVMTAYHNYFITSLVKKYMCANCNFCLAILRVQPYNSLIMSRKKQDFCISFQEFVP